MKALRDMMDAGYFVFGGEFGVRVDGPKVMLTLYHEPHTIPREVFDALVDDYIGTPAIRAALKAKDEEIARLKGLLEAEYARFTFKKGNWIERDRSGI